MALKSKRKVSESTLAKRMAKAVRKEVDRLVGDLPEARFEAATVPYQNRSWLYQGVQDAQYDIDQYTRTELLRVSRYFEENSWVVQRLVEVWNQYIFGSNGLAMIPSSSDENYNQAAGDWWNGFSKFPDLTSQQPLSVLEHVMGRRWFVDGEIWIYKTKSPDTGRPRIQLIESHRIANPGTNVSEIGNRIQDGMELDESTGRPVSVYVAETPISTIVGGYQGNYMNSGLLGNNLPNPLASQTTTYKQIPIDRMIHLFDPMRAQQHRGIGRLYPVLRTIQDLHELNYLEKLAAKDAARTSAWITNGTGQANPRALRALQLKIGSTDAKGNVETKPAPQYFETVEGAERQYLKTGEDVKFLASQRPSTCVQWFYDYLVRQVCAGTGISALLVMPWSLQGTVTRADLDIMAGFFRGKSSVAIAAIRELYVWAMSWAVKFDRSLDGYPDDWAEVTARPPRAPNVDVGNNSQAMLAEYQACVKSLSDICSEYGYDWRQVMRQKAIEEKFKQELAVQFGIDPDKLQQLALQAIQKPQDGQGDFQGSKKDDALAALTANVL